MWEMDSTCPYPTKVELARPNSTQTKVGPIRLLSESFFPLHIWTCPDREIFGIYLHR